MFKAETIMKTDLITAQRQDPIYEAIRTLVDNNITGLPVVDDEMTLIGIITEKDVLRLLYDNEDKSAKVADFMTEQVISFGPEDSLIDIADSFINNHFRRVPIVTNGKLVGIISRKDIIACILKHRHKDIAGV
jgi:CBS domain-containing protein